VRFLVDYDETISNLHTAIFILEGYRVEMIADGADVLDRLATGQFALVFTDRQIPILDGERMVLALRSAGIRIPVVMISGAVAEFPLSARMWRAVSAALLKPARAAEMLAAIFAALHLFQPGLRTAA
jgi:DNA-binding response OmpR family regulator